jgi:allantoin racemase
MRIKYIVPFPFDADGLANRIAQIPVGALAPDTEVDCIPVRNSFDAHAPRPGASYYESALLDMYITEAGIRAEDEGYDAVVMDTVSDSGMYALRSRLSIPVVGPGLVSYAIAVILGKRFSVITYSEQHKFLYEKTLKLYHFGNKCSSIRAADITPDFEDLFGKDPDAESRVLTAEAEKAIVEDGADVILLGSTTMYQAADYMTARLQAPVVNPGPVAIKITESLVQLGLSHSKIGFQDPPALHDEKFFSLASA